MHPPSVASPQFSQTNSGIFVTPSGGNATAYLRPIFSLLPLSLHPGAVGALKIQALTPNFHKRRSSGSDLIYVWKSRKMILTDAQKALSLSFFFPWLSWWISEKFKERGEYIFVSFVSSKIPFPPLPVLPLGWPGWEQLEKRSVSQPWCLSICLPGRQPVTTAMTSWWLQGMWGINSFCPQLQALATILILQ